MHNQTNGLTELTHDERRATSGGAVEGGTQPSGEARVIEWLGNAVIEFFRTARF